MNVKDLMLLETFNVWSKKTELIQKSIESDFTFASYNGMVMDHKNKNKCYYCTFACSARGARQNFSMLGLNECKVYGLTSFAFYFVCQIFLPNIFFI